MLSPDKERAAADAAAVLRTFKPFNRNTLAPGDVEFQWSEADASWYVLVRDREARASVETSNTTLELAVLRSVEKLQELRRLMKLSPLVCAEDAPGT